jgi:hypothetical protein
MAEELEGEAIRALRKASAEYDEAEAKKSG